MPAGVALYAGRTNDLCIMHGALDAGVQSMRLNLTEGEICTGAQKLSQMVLLLFLTEQDSMPLAPDIGTDFMKDAKSGKFRTEGDVAVSFGQAADSILRQLQASETDDTADDERLTDLELLGMSFEDGVVQLRVGLTTAAGEERPIILPLNIPLAV